MIVISSQTEYLEELAGDSPELIEEINVIKQSCQKVYDRLDSINQNTLQSNLALRPVSIDMLIEDLIGEKQLENRNIAITYSDGLYHPFIMADPYYFSQAIENITFLFNLKLHSKSSPAIIQV